MAELSEPIASSDLSSNIRQQCFQLVKDNLQNMYRQSEMGWSDAAKLKEMQIDELHYILVCEERPKVVAFCSFMFDQQNDTDLIYVYEVQVHMEHRRKKYGRALMEYVETLAREKAIFKIMLTVFTANEAAQRFYHQLGYVLDPSPPSPRRLRKRNKVATYMILCKQL